MADKNGFGGGHAHYKIAKTYKLVGVYNGNGQAEDIETDIETMDDANYLLPEYEMAYGKDWTITIEEE
jgi:hypothetical protein